MRRQKIRKVLIFISFLLFPITLNYFSPAVIIMGSSEGIISGSFIVFSLQFLSAFSLGRAFCGWVCPAAGLQEACFMIQTREAKGGRLDWIKYFIWIPWLGMIAFSTIRAGGYHTINPFLYTERGISVAEPSNYLVYFTVVGLITVLALAAGRRAFCHYGCWMAPFMVIGTKIRNAFKWPALHLKVDKNKCINCKTCTKNCPMSLDVNGMVHKGSMVNSECILCGTCIDGCPVKVIRYSFKAGS